MPRSCDLGIVLCELARRERESQSSKPGNLSREVEVQPADNGVEREFGGLDGLGRGGCRNSQTASSDCTGRKGGEDSSRLHGSLSIDGHAGCASGHAIAVKAAVSAAAVVQGKVSGPHQLHFSARMAGGRRSSSGSGPGRRGGRSSAGRRGHRRCSARRPGRPPRELWSVDNNLNIANMDWEEFADNTDGDGIFRGFD